MRARLLLPVLLVVAWLAPSVALAQYGYGSNRWAVMQGDISGGVMFDSGKEEYPPRRDDYAFGSLYLGAAFTPMNPPQSMFFGGGSRDDRQGGSPLAMLAFAILGPLAAMMIQMAISRQREFAADRGGAEIVGSPMGLASALRRIETAARQVPLDATPATAHMFIMNPFSGMGGITKLFMSHPPTEERIQALMALRGGRI